MKLALIPPLSWISTSEVTNYQLMLPHLTQPRGEFNLGQIQKYTDHYRALAKRRDQWVILDNGEAEGQNNLSSAQLVGLAVYLQVQEVVVPDVMANTVETLNRMRQFFRDLVGIHNDAFGVREIQKLDFMGVVQGRTLAEARNCIDMMMELHGDTLHTLALPRHLLATTDINGIRLDLAEYIQHTYTGGVQRGVAIHCLGASPKWPRECQELGKQGIVRGMDTSMPYNYAFSGEYINEDDLYIKRPDKYFTRPARMFLSDAIHANIGTMKRWADGK